MPYKEIKMIKEELIHTTGLGVERIRRNLGLTIDDVVNWCKERIKQGSIERRGKNWYVSTDSETIIINVDSHTIITAHKRKSK